MKNKREEPIKRITIEQLNKKSETNDICFWGCGKRMRDICELYHNSPFLTRVCYLIDGNTQLQGKTLSVGTREVPVFSPSFINQLSQNTILIITSDQHQAIYSYIKSVCDNDKIQVFLYPIIYSAKSRWMIRWMNCLPRKRQLLFVAGNEPHENADEIVRYLLNEYKGKRYKISFLDERNYTDKYGLKHYDKRTLSKKSRLRDVLRFLRVYCRSKYLMYESEPVAKLNPKQKMIFLNHGVMPLKDVSKYLQQPEEMDYAMVPSKNVAEVFKEQYGISFEKQLYFMPPRVNCIRRNNQSLKELADIGNKSIILWLPTFRSLANSSRCDSEEKNSLLLIGDGHELNDILIANQQFLIIKKHPREKEQLSLSENLSNIKIINDDAEYTKLGLSLYDLLISSEALLTDYSGIYFEYLLLNRPIGFVTNDIQSYRIGFAYENVLGYMPGAIIETREEIYNFLHNVATYNDQYMIEREKLLKKVYGEHEKEDGARKFIDILDALT